MISKLSYIGYVMKSSKMIKWSRWDHLPIVFEEINSRMRCDAMKTLNKVVEISKEFPMIFNTYSYQLQ